MRHFKKTGNAFAALLLFGHLTIPAFAAGVVQGTGATNSGTDGVALGDDANASDTFTVAIGTSANAAGDHTIILGHEATGGNKSIVIGGHATGMANSVGIGHNVWAGDSAVAIGDNATSNGDGVALGSDVHAIAGQVAIGGRTLVGAGGANITGSTTINTTGTAPTVIGNTDAASTTALKGGSGSVNVTDTSTSINNNGNGLTVFKTAQAVGAGQSINDNLKDAQYVNKLQGNTLIDGNMYVNGMLNYVTTQSATTQVNGLSSIGTSILPNATQGTVGQLNIVNKGSNGATESSASLTLQNGIGNTHGLEVYENRTILSGGTTSTQMLLDDNGVSFSNKQTGAPVKITGVADGTKTYDAVNFGQLQNVEKQMSRGIAMVSALSSIPQVDGGKTFSIGAGTGVYNGQAAVSVGGSYRFSPNAIMKVGVGLANGEYPAANAGVAYSW